MSQSQKKTAGSISSKSRRAQKKALVLGAEKKQRFPLIAAGILVGLLLMGGAYVWIQKSGEPAAQTTLSQQDENTPNITYPVGLFDDGKARYFSFAADNSITVKYFVLKSSDGVIRAAFDACDVCWPAGKGYEQSGDHMVCRNCGRRFASVLVNEVKGGCNPAPLKRAIENGTVVIQKADIMEGSLYFNFTRKG